MKKLLLLLPLFLFSCSADSETESTAKLTYITDSDFRIEILYYEEKIDYTNDGIINFTEIRTNESGIINFTKSTNQLMNEIYDSSNNGVLIINKYWGKHSKILDFTVYGQITTNYDSTWDNQSKTYEYSETTIIYKEL